MCVKERVVFAYNENTPWRHIFLHSVVGVDVSLAEGWIWIWFWFFQFIWFSVFFWTSLEIWASLEWSKMQLWMELTLPLPVLKLPEPLRAWTGVGTRHSGFCCPWRSRPWTPLCPGQRYAAIGVGALRDGAGLGLCYVSLCVKGCSETEACEQPPVTQELRLLRDGSVMGMGFSLTALNAKSVFTVLLSMINMLLINIFPAAWLPITELTLSWSLARAG